MSKDRQAIGSCPDCAGNNYSCTFNHFKRDHLTIDSWEHRCQDCGHRKTSAIRSDDEIEEDSVAIDPTLCPFCWRQGSCD